MQLNLTLGAVDLAKTERFYRDVLLLSPEFLRHGSAATGSLLLPCGATKIVFQQVREMECRHPALLQNLTRVPLGVGVQLELSCNNLDDIYRRVRYYRWPIAYELEDREHQRRELWLQDPDGYLLVLNED